MVCQSCGSPVEQEVRFCPKCGTQVAGPAQVPPAYLPMYAGQPYMAPPIPRVQRNLQTLGVLWCIYAGYRVLQGFLGMFFLRTFSHGFGGGWPFHSPMPGAFPLWMGAMVPLVGVFTAIGAGLSLLVGFSLLNRKPWGRTVAIVVAILALFKFPIGTALGIYTLWVLAPTVSGMEYEAIADRS
jgi:hypothetical protein